MKSDPAPALTYLEIAVNVPQVSGVFHYHLPPELEGVVIPGHLVEVPFGKQRVQGVVLRQVEAPAVRETKAVLALIDPEVAVTPAQLALAEHLAYTTLAPLSSCISLMLPVGLAQVADTSYRAAGRSAASGPQQLTDLQRRLLDLLFRRGPLLGRQLDRALPRANWRSAMRALLRRGLVTSQTVLQPPVVKPKTVRTASLAIPPEAVEEQHGALGRPGSEAFHRRRAILRCLVQAPSPVDVVWVYAATGGSAADLRYLADRGLVHLGESQAWRDPLAGSNIVPKEPPPLIREQQAAWEAIRAAISADFARLSQRRAGAEPGEAPGRNIIQGNAPESSAGLEAQTGAPFLLHGVTGSGKTEIYLHAAAEVLRLGRSALVLVPEIALTPQTVRRFQARFPGLVGLVHSRLSPGERYDTWRRARRGELRVIVGPRSALFTPLPDPGLIVVDECHDDSYYQSESPPYYHAREVAVAYARLTGAVCLLGSATPDLESRYRADQGSWRYLRLPDRILAHRQVLDEQIRGLPVERTRTHYRPLEHLAETTDLPPVRVIDMRQELKKGNRSIFSRSLQTGLARVLEAGQQAILFLNRRGTATYVFCRDCGESLRCPRCGTPLTYHAPPRSPRSLTPAGPPGLKEGKSRQGAETTGLTCHHCGYRRGMPASCPNCGSAAIRQFGTGTERVESEIQVLFPGARTLRWDYDTTRHKGAHELILDHFLAHRADILIGTQMLAKGLDLPLVTLVGVVLADVGLNLPDFHAAERVFQVLTQVAGRAGRSPLGGEVILQTYQPDHYVIRAAAGHDYQAFYLRELGYRRELGYPPFNQLVRLETRQTSEAKARGAAEALAAQLREWIEGEGRQGTTRLIGPVPCFFDRLGGLHRWQVILLGPDPAGLLRGRPLEGWRIEVNPPSLL